MTYTTNYNLHKPEETDSFSIDDWNINSDIIDETLKVNADNITVTDKKTLYYGTCSTSRATNAKVVTCSEFVLEAGCKIVVKFTDTAGAAPTSGNITLNINSTGAKNVYNKNNTQMTYSHSGEFRNNRYCEFTYDGTNFIWLNYDSNSTYSGMVDAVCSTDAATAAKTASGTNLSTVKAGALVLIYFNVANTAQSALTLNCGGSGVKPLYINGSVSSASNYTVNKATYLAYYDGTNWYIRNDSKLPFTKSDLGLSNVDNTADADKAVKSADKWTTARDITISDSDGTNTGTAVAVDGSDAKTLKLPSTIKANITGNCSGSSGSCTGNAATATNAKSANNTIAYCSTAAGTAAKTASLSNFVLESGQRILLYIANANSVASATLNVNSTGAKAIKINGTTNVTASNLPKGYYMAYYTVVSDVGYWYLYPILNLNTGTSFNGTSTGITTDANFGALGVKAWYFSSTSSYIVFTNGLKIQWFKQLANGTHNFVLPFIDWVCSTSTNQSGYPVGVYREGSSPYTQFRTASNYSTNKTDLIFFGY